MELCNVTGKFQGYAELVKKSKAGKDYTQRTLLVEIDDSYKDKIKKFNFPFDVFGDKLIEAIGKLKFEQEITVSFKLDSFNSGGNDYGKVKAIIVKAGKETEMPF